MTITEESRDRLYQRLKEAVGDTEATTLMEHLPPVGWADVATKTDLDHLREVMNLRFTGLERDTNRRFDEVARRFDEQDLRVATTADVADVRGAVHKLRAELHEMSAELHKAIRVHTVAIIGAMAAMNGTMVALLR